MTLHPPGGMIFDKHDKSRHYLTSMTDNQGSYCHSNLPMHPLTSLDLPPGEFARKLSARENLVFYSIAPV